MKTKLPPAALACLVILALTLHAGSSLNLLYPIGAAAVGMWLEAVSPGAFVRFVMWLWIVSPLVRRLVDFQAGWHDPSPVLLTPYLVTAWPVIKLSMQVLLNAARAATSGSRSLLPIGSAVFVIAALGIAMGIPLGFMAAPRTTAVEMLNWLVPIGFGWYIVARADRTAEIEQAVVSTFRVAALVVGGYGIYQFLNLPPWDVEWMRNAEMGSIGRPVPLQVRVFSTMHSPGVLGFFLLVPLALWLARPTFAGLPATCVAAIALGLSQVRSAWMGLGVAALFVLCAMPARARVRLAVMATLAVLCAAPFALTPDVAELVSARAATLIAPSGDTSALSRVEGHFRAFDFVGARPLGGGMGYEDRRIAQVIGMNDSVLVSTLVQFGLVGAGLYACALLLLLGRLWRYYRAGIGPVQLGLAGAAFGLLSTAFLGVITTGPQGVIFWLLGGLASARVCAWPGLARSRDHAGTAAPEAKVRWVPDSTWRPVG